MGDGGPRSPVGRAFRSPQRSGPHGSVVEHVPGEVWVKGVAAMGGPSGHEPVGFSERERIAAEHEARHDVAARRSVGDPLAVQHYLAQRREEENRARGARHRPTAGPGADAPAEVGDAGALAVEEPEAAEASALRRPRLVVGVDGSDGSRIALEAALVEAAGRAAALDVVIAFPLVSFWADGLGYVPGQAAEFRAAGERRVRDVVDEVVTGPLAGVPGVDAVDVRVVGVYGQAASVLLTAAEGVDLLVVGSRGRGGLRSTLLGSVGLHCISHAPCDVLVVRSGQQPDRPPRIVVGFDESPGSRAALATAVEDAVGIGADVEVVACYTVAAGWELERVAAPDAEKMRRQVEDSVATAVREVVRSRTDAPRIATQVELAPARDVLTAQARGAYRLVVGSHGHGTFHGLVLGSVALHCAMHAPAPVLVVRPSPVAGVSGTAGHEPAMADR